MYICTSNSKGVIRFVTCFLHLIFSGNVFKRLFPCIIFNGIQGLYKAPQSENRERTSPSDWEGLAVLRMQVEGWEREDVTSPAKAEAGILQGAGWSEGGVTEREEGAARARRGAGRGGAGRRVAVTQGGHFKPKEGNAAAPSEGGVGVAIARPL